MKYLFPLIFLWQIPQNLLAIIYLAACFSQMRPAQPLWVRNRWGVPVVAFSTASRSGSVSLGSFVFVSRLSGNSLAVLKHELGHTIQSLILGPLYLLVIGLPSICWATARSLGYFRRWRYGDFFTERWANHLS